MTDNWQRLRLATRKSPATKDKWTRSQQQMPIWNNRKPLLLEKSFPLVLIAVGQWLPETTITKWPQDHTEEMGEKAALKL
jgi:hypothetical protein